MDIFYIIMQQIIKFSLMIIIGIICVRSKVLKQESLEVLSKFILRVILPLCILYNILNGATRADVISNFYIIPVSAVIYGVLILNSWLLAKVFKLEFNRGKTFQAVMTFGNIGFIGIPLIIAIFPSNGMVFVSLYSIVDQLIVWTYCVYLTTKDSKGVGLSNLKRMINPALISIVIAISIIMIGIELPTVLMETIESVGSASSPLCLIYIGACLALCDLRKVIKSKEIYVGIFVKMFCLPILTYFILYNVMSLGLDVAMTMAIIVALPSMVTTTMMVTTNNPPESDYCIGATMLTQISSMLLLPIISYIMMVMS